MSDERMEKCAAELEAEVERWLSAAEVRTPRKKSLRPRQERRGAAQWVEKKCVSRRSAAKA